MLAIVSSQSQKADSLVFVETVLMEIEEAGHGE